MNAAGPAGPIGSVTLEARTLEHGDNVANVVMVVDLSLASAVNFMSSVDTTDTTLVLTGFAGSTPNVAMAAANEAFNFSVVIPKKFGAVA
ncbi:hypothetical protein BG000_005051 [Podila horticola]|nr:hypothetical protein BG000_005051 [Podila horticola]